MKLTINEILKATQGEIIVDGKNYDYESIDTDTRKLNKNSIFIALKGDNFNGNNFVLEAIKKGSTICLVSEIKFNKEEIPSDVTIIKVKDTKKALLFLSKSYREKLNIKIIGVTGSTGKTSTKDIIAAFLSDKYKVFKTKGNFNNEIGLPLMIFSLDETYDVAVLEMGMSNLKEIHNLANAAMPDMAVITNVGISHIENLKTRENILKAKLEVTDFFNKDSILVVNADNDMLKDISSDNYKIIKIGMDETAAEVRGINIKLTEKETSFDIEDSGKNIGRITLPMVGKHNVLNSLLAYVIGKNLELNIQDMNNGIQNLEATSMRLDITKNDNITIIDDCYNASPDSMKAAIDVLSEMTGKRKVLILGTMRELGHESENAHMEVGRYAKDKNIDELIAVGEYSHMFKEGFEKNILEFETTDECSNNIKNLIKDEDIILVKASRGMKFEKIVNKLKEV